MKINKIKKLALIFFLLLILSGCGINLDESMKIDKTFSGVREMTLTFDEETVDSIEGGADAITKLLKDNIKEPLSLTILDAGPDSFTARLDLSFTSLDDYIRKANKLYELGFVQDEIQVIFSVDNKDFNKEIIYKDNIDSKKLLKFLVDKSIDNGLINENNRDSVWEDSTFNLFYEDEILIENGSLPYEYSDSIYIGPEEIIMTTSLYKGQINRVYNFVFLEENESYLNENQMSSMFNNQNLQYMGRFEKEFKDVDYVFHRYLLRGNEEDVKRVNDEIFAVDSSFTFEENNNIDTFSRDFIISEEIGHNRFSDKSSIYSFYEKEDIDAEDHSMASYEEIINNESATRFIADELALENTFSFIDKSPVSFSELFIETNITSKGISRTLNFDKSDEQSKRNVEDFLLKYLDKNNIEYQDLENKTIVRYSEEDFEQVNSLLFEDEVSLELENNSLFTVDVSYEEDSKLEKFQVSEIKQEVSFESFSNLDRNIVETSESGISNSIKVREIKVENIAFSIIILLGLFILGIILYRKYENKNLEEILAEEIDDNE